MVRGEKLDKQSAWLVDLGGSGLRVNKTFVPKEIYEDETFFRGGVNLPQTWGHTGHSE